ncbi:MAG: glycosyltransferase family 2 protein [Candidatus Woesearchaeota archaeon]|nr:glycosyltransferase family 2 protein [Candidatus Woesearchaeota archaeon]
MDAFVDFTLWIIYLILLYLNLFWLTVYFFTDEEHKTQRFSSLPKVTIAIPAHNEEEVIELTMRSAMDLEYPKELLEIIVIDNKSTDNTFKIAEKVRKSSKLDIHVVRLEEKGKGLALNHALEIAKGEFFVLFDADSFVEKKALKKLLPYFTNEKIACVLPMMKVGRIENLLQKLQWYEYVMNLFYKRMMGRIDCVHVAPGPFSIYRKDILKKIGGFSHPNLTEDLEITLRLQKHHYKIIQTSDAEVKTIAPKNMKDLYRQRNRWYKGSIFNSLKYKSLWFNKEYGDFGFVQMPTIMIPGIFAVIILGVHIFYFFKSTFESIYKLYTINFDIMPMIINFHFTFNILDGNHTRGIIAILMLLTGLLTFYLSHRIIGEKLTKHGVLPAVLFLFLFPFFLSYVWATIFIELIFKRVQEW